MLIVIRVIPNAGTICQALTKTNVQTPKLYVEVSSFSRMLNVSVY